MNPQLVNNWLEDKTRLPTWQQPKWDGVRGLYILDQFTGRSLKAFKNKALTAFWSAPQFKWLDGELIYPGADESTPRLCSITTGLTGRVNATEVPDWIVFDYVDPALLNRGATYRDRFDVLTDMVITHQKAGTPGYDKIQLIENYPVKTLAEVLEMDEGFLERGLEGSILRNPDAYYKEGRPSTKVQEIMRIKNFIDFEFRIDSLYEAMENQNEAKTNELGHTERSSHKANKVAKGMVGGFNGTLLDDVMYRGKKLFEKGQPIKVGAGQSTHEERKRWWENPDEVCGKIGKGKTFPQGTKDKLRMPIFLCLRSQEDM